MNFKRTSVIAALLCAAAASQASISWFTTLGGWNGSAGATSFTENFSGFVTDTQFRTGAVGINGGSIAQEGTNASNFRNLIDVSPFDFTDNNGTAHASMLTNSGVTTVRMTFANALSAFGFETWIGQPLEGASVDVYNGATLLGSFDISNVDGSFTGFVLDGGDTATSIVWRSTTFVDGPGGEGFGLDNLVGVNAMNPVPEPFTMVLLGGAALAGYRRVRARKLG